MLSVTEVLVIYIWFAYCEHCHKHAEVVLRNELDKPNWPKKGILHERTRLTRLEGMSSDGQVSAW